MLVILDGWGIGTDPARSAIAQANTPFYDGLIKNAPHAQLLTHGKNVGLPDGQMGNSEVGHLNIGAGRVVYQDLARISKLIEDDRLGENEVLNSFIDRVNSTGKTLHIMGLLSDGGVHSHIEHLVGFIDHFKDEGIKNIAIHAFLDGRDTDPEAGAKYLEELMKSVDGTKVRLASVIGRYYAMDRDRRWDRIKVAYDLLIKEKGRSQENAIDAVRAAYADGITDEFMEPIIVKNHSEKTNAIEDGDHVFFFNFRTDRPRQLTEVLTQTDHEDHGMSTLDLDFVTMTEYDRTFRKVHVLYKKEEIDLTLGEILAANNRTQLRAAETEKYAHVTYFFNGGREQEFEGESRLLVASPKVATYDHQPEMSAHELTDKTCHLIKTKQPDFIALNYANADMVGHTGVFSAAIKAAETVDSCLRQLSDTALKNDYKLIIIADHGNSDYMINEDGSPNTAHTTNPVPCILLGSGDEDVTLRDGILADVAPTILQLMGIDQPSVMTGASLIE